MPEELEGFLRRHEARGGACREVFEDVGPMLDGVTFMRCLHLLARLSKGLVPPGRSQPA